MNTYIIALHCTVSWLYKLYELPGLYFSWGNDTYTCRRFLLFQTHNHEQRPSLHCLNGSKWWMWILIILRTNSIMPLMRRLFIFINIKCACACSIVFTLREIMKWKNLFYILRDQGRADVDRSKVIWRSLKIRNLIT